MELLTINFPAKLFNEHFFKHIAEYGKGTVMTRSVIKEDDEKVSFRTEYSAPTKKEDLRALIEGYPAEIDKMYAQVA